MIIKHFDKEAVRNQALALGAKYAVVIGRDWNNPRSLWTHLGNGYWIGCWHPNPNGMKPRPLRAVTLYGLDYDVMEQFLPPEMTVEIIVNGFRGTEKQTPNIRIMKTKTWPGEYAIIVSSGQKGNSLDVIGHRGGELVGMTMEAWPQSGGLEYEVAPFLDDQQSWTARLESGESGGPSFDITGKNYLHGIHRGGGGQKGDRWISAVDVWLGHPQVRDWIMDVIGFGEEVEPVKEPIEDIVVQIPKPKPGQRIILEVAE